MSDQAFRGLPVPGPSTRRSMVILLLERGVDFVLSAFGLARAFESRLLARARGAGAETGILQGFDAERGNLSVDIPRRLACALIILQGAGGVVEGEGWVDVFSAAGGIGEEARPPSFLGVPTALGPWMPRNGVALGVPEFVKMGEVGGGGDGGGVLNMDRPRSGGVGGAKSILSERSTPRGPLTVL